MQDGRKGRAGQDGVKGNMADDWLLANYRAAFARACACGVTKYNPSRTGIELDREPL
jgi:hypothetical protein